MICGYQHKIMVMNLSAKSKLIWLVTFLISIGNDIHAQNKNVFGGMVGMNVSSISNYDGKAAPGMTVGLYWERKLSSTFSLQSNFLYSQRGERAGESTPELKLQYIHLPIMTKYYITDSFQVMAGIYWDLLLGIAGDNHFNSDFKSGDFGIPVGASYDLSNHIQLDLSYNIGLTNISNSPDFVLRNSWVSVTVAILGR